MSRKTVLRVTAAQMILLRITAAEMIMPGMAAAQMTTARRAVARNDSYGQKAESSGRRSILSEF